MGRSNRGRRRAPRQIETFEPRLFLSAEPLADFSHTAPGYEVLESIGSPSVQLIDAHELTGLSDARAAYGFAGTGQTVVVIDSGIAYDHVALGGGFGAGYQVVGGWDFTEENDANPYDDGPWGSHGTHVSGIIASQDAVYPGVAPGVDLVALRVFNDSGEGYFSWIEDALSWVHDNRNAFENPITTVNLSIGSTWNSDAVPSWAMLEEEFAQLEADGIFISVAAGNDFTSFNTTGLSYPAASSYVVPVASVDDDGSLSYFTQRNDRVIAAPGRSVVSTLPDYVGNLNGQNDDFGSYSGTSMAAPYVAGASVLLREALGLVGVSNVTQDVIYDWMRDTADLVFDAATGQNYHRLNLGSALDAIMPDDDFGSVPSAAHWLGTVVDATSFSGLIGRLDDSDYFSFTAALTGTLTVQSQTSYALVVEWDLSAMPTAQAAGLTFDVVAGQTYVIGLGTSEGLGYYDISLELEPGQTDLGTITSNRIDGISLQTGSAAYTLTASRDGLLTVEALFSLAAGELSLEIFDTAGNHIATSSAVAAGERIDVVATAGQTFVVQITGTNADVDLRLTNLVHADGPAVHVYGTDADDSFSFVAGAMHELEVNGVGYEFDAQSVTEVEFFGGAGQDAISLDTSTLVGGMMMARINSPSSVRLVAALPGDANLDGAVDHADYTAWAAGFGAGNPDFTQGDFNQDGTVNAADYTIWANHFGSTSTATANAADSARAAVTYDSSLASVVAVGRSEVAEEPAAPSAGVSSASPWRRITAAYADHMASAPASESLRTLLYFTHATDHLPTGESGADAFDSHRVKGFGFDKVQTERPATMRRAWYKAAENPDVLRAPQHLDAVHETESEPWQVGHLEFRSLANDGDFAFDEIWQAWSIGQTPHDAVAEALLALQADAS